MTQGTKRTPTALLEARGAFEKNPQRRKERSNEPKPTKPIGDPPAHFNGDQVDCWHELLEKIPHGVAFEPDSISLEMASVLLAEIRYGKASAWQYQQLHRCLAAFGMTPADRSKVQAVSEDVEDDPWAEMH